MPLPLSSEQLALLCGEIDRELRALVTAQAAGHLTEPQFVQAMLRIEEERASAHGLIMTASHTFDEWTVVSLRVPGCTDPCASFEFHSASGDYRAVGTACRCCDPSLPRQTSGS
jgi:hypothetical protein